MSSASISSAGQIGITLGFHFLYFIFPPYIPAFNHRNGVRVRVSTITLFTEWHCTNASSITSFNGISLLPRNPPSAVITDSALCIMHPVGDDLCRKTAENNGVNSSDPGTGQNSNSQFGNHGHINTNTVTFFYTIIF